MRIAARVLVLIFALSTVLPANAAIIEYFAALSGPAESPPNASPGTGTALVTIDTAAVTMRVEASFEDLIGTTTAAHIHGPTAVPFEGAAGVMTTTPSFPGFPLGVTSGNYDAIFGLDEASTYNPVLVASQGSVEAARAALLDALAEGRGYFNIHTNVFPGGEIRGFLNAVPVPVPGVPTLLLVGLGMLAVSRRFCR